MEIKKEKVWIRILASMWNRGKTANSLEMMKDTNQRRDGLYMHLGYLQSRGLIKPIRKGVRRKDGTMLPNIWTIRPQKYEKIRNILKETYEGESNDAIDTSEMDQD